MIIVTCLTAAHMSLALVLGLMCLSRVLFCLVMSVPIRSASASASSIRPALMSLFLRRSLALMSGVMYSGMLLYVSSETENYELGLKDY